MIEVESGWMAFLATTESPLEEDKISPSPAITVALAWTEPLMPKNNLLALQFEANSETRPVDVYGLTWLTPPKDCKSLNLLHKTKIRPRV